MQSLSVVDEESIKIHIGQRAQRDVYSLFDQVYIQCKLVKGVWPRMFK